MRTLITNLLLIGQAIAFLVHLSLIAYYGQLLIEEPNPLILGLEFVLFCAIIALGLVNITGDIWRRRYG